MIDKIYMPKESVEILIDKIGKNNIYFGGYSYHDFWICVYTTKEILDCIISNNLQWRYCYL